MTQYALVAGAEAVAMAGLPADIGRAGRGDPGHGGGRHFSTWEDSYRAVFAEGKNRVSPLVVPRLMHNAAGLAPVDPARADGAGVCGVFGLRQRQSRDGAGLAADPRRAWPM